MATTFNSCYIYNKYHRPDDITVEGLFRDTVSDTDTLAADSVSFGDLPWEEVFTRPHVAGAYSHGIGAEQRLAECHVANRGCPGQLHGCPVGLPPFA